MQLGVSGSALQCYDDLRIVKLMLTASQFKFLIMFGAIRGFGLASTWQIMGLALCQLLFKDHGFPRIKAGTLLLLVMFEEGGTKLLLQTPLPSLVGSSASA